MPASVIDLPGRTVGAGYLPHVTEVVVRGIDIPVSHRDPQQSGAAIPAFFSEGIATERRDIHFRRDPADTSTVGEKESAVLEDRDVLDPLESRFLAVSIADPPDATSEQDNPAIALARLIEDLYLTRPSPVDGVPVAFGISEDPLAPRRRFRGREIVADDPIRKTPAAVLPLL